MLARIAQGRPSQSLILVGLRGVGKTVLLVRIKAMAEERSYSAVLVEANESKHLPELVVPELRRILFSLSNVENAKEKARRGLRVLRSFINSVRVKLGDFELGLSIEPELGTADSGDLETDLADLLLAVGEAAKAGRTMVALLIDELQYLPKEQFGALIMALHRTTQNNIPITMIGAGLPQILALAGEAKSYAERLFKYPQIGALQPEDASAALVKPAAEEGVSYHPKALEQILAATERYPYFLQQWGYEVWNMSEGPIIRGDDVRKATHSAIRSLDESFFKVRFDRCTPAERRYLRALAELGPGAHRSGDIAEKLGVRVTAVGPTRNNLIRKGMIYSPQHGDTAFTVPLFDAYMRRVMPAMN